MSQNDTDFYIYAKIPQKSQNLECVHLSFLPTAKVKQENPNDILNLVLA